MAKNNNDELFRNCLLCLYYHKHNVFCWKWLEGSYRQCWKTNSGVCKDSLSLVNVRYAKNWHEKYDQGGANTPHNREEIKNLGLKEYMKKYKQYAQFNYQEWRYPEKQRAIDISCTRQVADPYKVEEGSGVSSLLKSPRNKLLDIRADILSNRNVKKRVIGFHRKRFPAEAQDIYLEVHNLLNTENWTVVKKPATLERLDKLVTEHAFPDMVKGLSAKTLQWKYIETIEPPRVVKIRTPVMITDTNLYGQVTVRFYSKQNLAIYDRFGRLMFGSPSLARNVLEYVVFERHISHPYGMWRIHAKIPAELYKEPTRRTVAIVQPNVLREESEAWHDQEEKECVYKWYPQRHNVINLHRKGKRTRKGREYWARHRKHHVLCVKHTRPSKIRRKTQKLVNSKRRKVVDMRQSGKLPYPPLEPNP